MKTTRIRGTALVAALVLPLAIGACSTSDDLPGGIEGDDRFDLSGQSVRIGTAAETPLDIGTGYSIELLRSWGADVEREELTDVGGLQAIVADRIDITGRSSDEVIDAHARDIEVVAIGAASSAMHYVIIGDPDITSVADLSGRTVAISGPGGFDTVILDALLAEEGMTRGVDVTDVAIGGSSERTSSLLADQADASMVFLDDWLALSERTDDVHLIGHVSELMPGLSSRTYAAPREWLDDNPEMALALACANLEANRWINEDQEGYVEFATDRITGVTEDSVTAFHEAALDLEMFPTEPSAILNPSQYEATADMLVTGGVLDEVPDLSGAVDTSYLEEAAEQGCGQG